MCPVAGKQQIIPTGARDHWFNHRVNTQQRFLSGRHGIGRTCPLVHSEISLNVSNNNDRRTRVVSETSNQAVFELQILINAVLRSLATKS